MLSVFLKTKTTWESVNPQEKLVTISSRVMKTSYEELSMLKSSSDEGYLVLHGIRIMCISCRG